MRESIGIRIIDCELKSMTLYVIRFWIFAIHIFTPFYLSGKYGTMYLLGYVDRISVNVIWGYVLIACQGVSFCMAVILGTCIHFLSCWF